MSVEGGHVVYMRRGKPPHHFTLIPIDDRAVEAIGKIPVDEPVGVRITRDRSLPHHRLFFAILDHVAHNSKFETAERLLVALKVRLGRYDVCRLPSGKLVPVPHSISFSAMSEDEFSKFFNDAVALICSEVVPGTDSERLIGEVEAMLTPRASSEIVS